MRSSAGKVAREKLGRHFREDRGKQLVVLMIAARTLRVQTQLFRRDRLGGSVLRRGFEFHGVTWLLRSSLCLCPRRLLSRSSDGHRWCLLKEELATFDRVTVGSTVQFREETPLLDIQFRSSEIARNLSPSILNRRRSIQKPSSWFSQD